MTSNKGDMDLGELLFLAATSGSIGATEIIGSLTLSNALGGRYDVGQTWTLTLERAQPNSAFAICVSKDKSEAVCTGNFGRTDSSGSWTRTGSFNADTVGAWTEWIQFASGARSNRISFTVGNPALGTFTINGGVGGNFAPGQSWRITVSGAPANTPFGLCAAFETGPANCVPNFGTTDPNGAWTLSGTFLESARGGWTEWLQMPGGYDSNRLAFTVGTEIAYQLHGLNLGPYVGSQDPNTGLTITEEQIKERISRVAPYTHWIRSFSSTRGLEHIGRVARGFGLKTAIGAWLARNSSANEQEIAGALAVYKSGFADMLIIGSETLYRRDLTGSQLAGYLTSVKQAAPSTVVATADTAQSLLENPAVVAACDVILVNIYPYWEGIDIKQAISSLDANYKALAGRYPDKEIIISETGWPSGGNPVASASPNPQNAVLYVLSVVSWARAFDRKYFYFEAFDEAWKARYEGPQGAHWGIWSASGVLKPGMSDVFNGKTVPISKEPDPPSCAPGGPRLEFTYVPQYGTTDNLRGRVCNVIPSNYRVVVYIRVSGRWWIKPFANQPLTTIQSDGRWIADITTGGIDEKATEIGAYLVPSGFSPPALLSALELPATLDQAAIAQTRTTRTVCEFKVGVRNRSLAADSQSGSAAVTVNAGCNWEASSNVDWITITSGASGSGNGTVSYLVAANMSGSSRSGSLTIAGMNISIVQAGEGVTCGGNSLLAYGASVVCIKTEKTDEYQFFGNNGDLIMIEGTALDASQFLPCVDLVRPSGAHSRACALSLFNRLILVLNETGPHRIAMSGGASGVYTLSVERLLPPGPAASEVSYNAPITGEISPAGDLDVYYFHGQAGSRIRVTASRVSGLNFLPCVLLTMPDATWRYACNLALTNAIDTQLSQTGVHTVMINNQIGAYGPVAGGKYSLSLLCLEGACGKAK